jgi:ParB family transcriptional regulator, chromosome partitioning protein
MFASEITIDRIEVAAGRRAIDPAVVNHLVKSIAAVGLQHPITVRQRDGGYVLVAGAHRLEAFRKRGIERIPANVVDLNPLEAELLEIDENLVRNELSPAERAAAIARRKGIYEQLHPETKHGAMGGGHGKDSAGDKADRFSKATAEATGRSERAVQLDAARGKTLGQETLAKVAGTSLDKGAELDALAELPVDEREALVDRASAGEPVSAQAVAAVADKPKLAGAQEPMEQIGAGAEAPNTEKSAKVAAAVVLDDLDNWDFSDEERALAYAFAERAELARAAASYSKGALTPRVLEKSSAAAVAWVNLTRALSAELAAMNEREANQQ